MDAWPGSRSGGYRVIRFRERATNVIRATFTANCPKLSKHCVQTCSFAIRCQQVSGSPTEKRFVVSENIKIYSFHSLNNLEYSRDVRSGGIKDRRIELSSSEIV